MTIVDKMYPAYINKKLKRLSERFSTRDGNQNGILETVQHVSSQFMQNGIATPSNEELNEAKREINAPSRDEDAGLKVVTATASCPKKPDKSKETKTRRDCGEDAVFVCRNFPPDNSMQRVCCIGVADGVGSYAARGIDPSVFAWAIMEEIQKIFETEPNVSCIQALTKGYDAICNSSLVQEGGSTACIVSIHQAKDSRGEPVLKLTAASLGDSSFMIIRNGKVLYRSEEQMHSFNCPYQLAVPRGNIFNSTYHDDPSKAIVIGEPGLTLLNGDVVIVTTDGLTDNVFDSDVARIVASVKEENSKKITATIASELLKTAYINSRSKEIYTPFAKYSSENNHCLCSNGKIDDITFVVALVTHE